MDICDAALHVWFTICELIMYCRQGAIEHAVKHIGLVACEFWLHCVPTLASQQRNVALKLSACATLKASSARAARIVAEIAASEASPNDKSSASLLDTTVYAPHNGGEIRLW